MGLLFALAVCALVLLAPPATCKEDCDELLDQLTTRCFVPSAANSTAFCPVQAVDPRCCQALGNYVNATSCPSTAQGAGITWAPGCATAPSLFSDLLPVLCAGCFDLFPDDTFAVADCQGNVVDFASQPASLTVCSSGMKVCSAFHWTARSAANHSRTWASTADPIEFVDCRNASASPVCGSFIVVGQQVVRIDSKGLYAQSNRISNLPTQIGLMTNLVTLRLESNFLSDLPTEVGLLNSLSNFLVSKNYLATLPSEVAQLSQLTGLWLDDNDLYSFGPVTALTNLEALYAKYAWLTDIPSDIGQLTKLRTLDLAGNRISALPSELALLTNLAHLSVDGNLASKVLPSQFGLLRSLSSLVLQVWGFEVIPSEIGMLENVLTMVIRYTAASTLPSQFCLLTNLQVLDLSGNKFVETGSELGCLSGLFSLDLSSNALTALPSQIGVLPSLATLSASFNWLHNLPSQLGNLPAISFLHLHHNLLLELPSEFGLLASLRALDVQSNFLASLPVQMAQLSTLERLVASNNEILQDIATLDGLFQTSNLVVLVNNRLVGETSSVAHFNQSKHLLEQNCLSKHSKSQNAIGECMSVRLVDFPSAYSNDRDPRFAFEEAAPRYRADNDFEPDTEYIWWLWCLRALGRKDVGKCGLAPYKYGEAFLTDLEDDTFVLDVRLVINLRAMDRCKEAVSKLLGPVEYCSEDDNTCKLLGHPSLIDCTLDDIHGKALSYQWSVDTLPPLVHILATDDSGVALTSGQPVVGVREIHFSTEPSETRTTFSADAIQVTGCANMEVLRNASEIGVQVVCRDVQDGDVVTLLVPAGAFSDLAGNPNRASHVEVVVGECPEDYFQTFEGCAGATSSERCHECSACYFPRVVNVACSRTADTICSSVWMGLAPFWGPMVLVLITIAAITSIVKLPRVDLALVVAAAFSGMGSLASGCFFLMFDAHGAYFTASAVFWIAPCVVNAVGVLLVHHRALRSSREYHLVSNEKGGAMTVVLLMSCLVPRLLDTMHRSLGSRFDWNLRRTIQVVAGIPIVLQAIPQLAIQAMSMTEVGTSYTSVLAITFVVLSVMFQATQILLQVASLRAFMRRAHLEQSLLDPHRVSVARPSQPSILADAGVDDASQSGGESSLNAREMMKMIRDLSRKLDQSQMQLRQRDKDNRRLRTDNELLKEQLAAASSRLE